MKTHDRYFEDYQVGEVREAMSRTVTETDIVIHAGQTGDFFPHHMDAQWCATQPFGQRIAHGTLVMSMAVGLTADVINPQSISYGYDKVRFITPVFINDTIHVRAEITAKREREKHPGGPGFVEEAVTVTKQDGGVVMSLIHLYLVNRRGSMP